MILLAVNYHYVEPEPREGARAIFPVSTASLRAQVEELARTFELVSRETLVAAVRDGRPLPERACMITFDDDLRCQYEHALPVLESLGAPATFFVSARPLREGRAVHVHRVHALRELLDEAEFERLLDAELAAEGIAVPDVDEDRVRAMYRYDAPAAGRLKYLLNVALPLDVRECVVEAIFAATFGDERAFCEALYMSAEQIVELERRHGAIGAHGYAHLPLASLTVDAAADDLARGAAALAEVVGRRPPAVSYPYGSSDAVSPAVAALADSAGFAFGFTMERALNRSLAQPLLLARIDANDAPGGKQPLFAVEDDDVTANGISVGRTRYLDEPVPATRPPTSL